MGQSFSSIGYAEILIYLKAPIIFLIQARLEFVHNRSFGTGSPSREHDQHLKVSSNFQLYFDFLHFCLDLNKTSQI